MSASADSRQLNLWRKYQYWGAGGGAMYTTAAVGLTLSEIFSFRSGRCGRRPRSAPIQTRNILGMRYACPSGGWRALLFAWRSVARPTLVSRRCTMPRIHTQQHMSRHAGPLHRAAAAAASQFDSFSTSAVGRVAASQGWPSLRERFDVALVLLPLAARRVRRLDPVHVNAVSQGGGRDMGTVINARWCALRGPVAEPR